jgi:hypothetical protein
MLNNVACLAEYRNDGTVVPKELGTGVPAVTVRQVASQRSGVREQRIWRVVGNRFIEALIHGKVPAKEAELVEVCVFFVVHP